MGAEQTDQIATILAEDFPESKLTNIEIISRKNGDKSLSVKIDGELFYLSFLPANSRTKIFQLLN